MHKTLIKTYLTLTSKIPNTLISVIRNQQANPLKSISISVVTKDFENNKYRSTAICIILTSVLSAL